MSIVEEDKTRGNNAGGQAVARLPHNHIRNRYGQGAENGWEGPESHVGYLVRNVRITNVLEVEVPVVTNQPSHEGEEKLPEGWMNIEEIGPFEIVRCELQSGLMSASCAPGKCCEVSLRFSDCIYLAEVDFVEDDFVGVADAPESGHKSEDGEDGKSDLVGQVGVV